MSTLVHGITLKFGLIRIELHKTTLPDMIELNLYAKEGLISMFKLEFYPDEFSSLLQFFKDADKKLKDKK